MAESTGFKSELFGGHMQAGSTLGPGGPGPQFVAGPQILEGFPVFLSPT